MCCSLTRGYKCRYFRLFHQDPTSEQDVLDVLKEQNDVVLPLLRRQGRGACVRACIRRATAASLFPLLTLFQLHHLILSDRHQAKRVVKLIQYLLHSLYPRRSSRLARSIDVDPSHCPVPLSALLARSAAARCLIKRTQRPSEGLSVSRRPSVRIIFFVSTANLLRSTLHCPVEQQRLAGLTSPAFSESDTQPSLTRLRLCKDRLLIMVIVATVFAPLPSTLPR